MYRTYRFRNSYNFFGATNTYTKEIKIWSRSDASKIESDFNASIIRRMKKITRINFSTLTNRRWQRLTGKNILKRLFRNLCSIVFVVIQNNRNKKIKKAILHEYSALVIYHLALCNSIYRTIMREERDSIFKQYRMLYKKTRQKTYKWKKVEKYSNFSTL